MDCEICYGNQAFEPGSQHTTEGFCMLKGTSRKRKLIYLKSTVWYVETKSPKLAKKKVSLVKILYFVKVNVMHGYTELVFG